MGDIFKFFEVRPIHEVIEDLRKRLGNYHTKHLRKNEGISSLSWSTLLYKKYI